MSTATMPWTLPPTWPVPREWDAAEPCFVLCSGESVGPQAAMIRQLKGRFIGVKHGMLLRPDADVFFFSGEGNAEVALSLIPKFRGTHMVVRVKFDPRFPESVKRVTRTKEHEALCTLTDHVCGYDMGTSAINLAYHFGARTIVMLGYDMTGGHYCKHPLQYPPQDHFRRHLGPLAALNADAKAKGVRLVNCSPISKVPFESQPLEAFL